MVDNAPKKKATFAALRKEVVRILKVEGPKYHKIRGAIWSRYRDADNLPQACSLGVIHNYLRETRPDFKARTFNTESIGTSAALADIVEELDGKEPVRSRRFLNHVIDLNDSRRWNADNTYTERTFADVANEAAKAAVPPMKGDLY